MTNSEDKVIEQNHTIMQTNSQMNTFDRIDTNGSIANRSISSKKARNSQTSVRKSSKSSRQKYRDSNNSNAYNFEIENDLAINFQRDSIKKIPNKDNYDAYRKNINPKDINTSLRNSSNSLNRKNNSRNRLDSNDAYDDIRIENPNDKRVSQKRMNTLPINNNSVEVSPKNDGQVEIRAKISKSEMKNMIRMLSSFNGIKDLEFKENSGSGEYLKKFGNDTITANITSKNKEPRNNKSRYRNKFSDQ